MPVGEKTPSEIFNDSQKTLLTLFTLETDPDDTRIDQLKTQVEAYEKSSDTPIKDLFLKAFSSGVFFRSYEPASKKWFEFLDEWKIARPRKPTETPNDYYSRLHQTYKNHPFEALRVHLSKALMESFKAYYPKNDSITEAQLQNCQAAHDQIQLFLVLAALDESETAQYNAEWGAILLHYQATAFKTTYADKDPITEAEFNHCKAAYEKMLQSPLWQAESLTELIEQHKTELEKTLLLYQTKSELKAKEAQKTHEQLHETLLTFFSCNKLITLDEINKYLKEVKEICQRYSSIKKDYPIASNIILLGKSKEAAPQGLAGYFAWSSTENPFEMLVKEKLAPLIEKAKKTPKQSFTWTTEELLKDYGKDFYLELRQYVLEKAIMGFSENFKTDKPVTFSQLKRCQIAHDLIINVDTEELMKLSTETIITRDTIHAVLKDNKANYKKYSDEKIIEAKKIHGVLYQGFLDLFKLNKTLPKKELNAFLIHAEKAFDQYKDDYPEAYAVFTEEKLPAKVPGWFGGIFGESDAKASLKSLLIDTLTPLKSTEEQTWTLQTLDQYRTTPSLALRHQVLKEAVFPDRKTKMQAFKNKFKTPTLTITFDQIEQCSKAFMEIHNQLTSSEWALLKENDNEAYSSFFNLFKEHAKNFKTHNHHAIKQTQDTFKIQYQEFLTTFITLEPQGEKATNDFIAQLNQALNPQYPDTLKVDFELLGGESFADGLKGTIKGSLGATVASLAGQLIEDGVAYATDLLDQAEIEDAPVYASDIIGQIDHDKFFSLKNSFQEVVKKILNEWPATVETAREIQKEHTFFFSFNRGVQAHYYKHLYNYYAQIPPSWIKFKTHLKYTIQSAMLKDTRLDEVLKKLNEDDEFKSDTGLKEWVKECCDKASKEKLTDQVQQYYKELSKKTVPAQTASTNDSEKPPQPDPSPPVEENLPPEVVEIPDPEPPREEPAPAQEEPAPVQEEPAPVKEECAPEKSDPVLVIPPIPTSTSKGEAASTEPTTIPPRSSRPISSAVEIAVGNYQRWFKDHSSPKFFAKKMEGAIGRGESYGTFSWARHHKSGQEKAKELLSTVQKCKTENEAIITINQFLTHAKTRYHLHSFASFLLDELRKIDSSPWQNIRLSKSNHYDKTNVQETVGWAAKPSI